MSRDPIVGYIPARGGSKRIRRKNIKELCGRPVLEIVIGNLFDEACCDEVFVSTEDDEIAAVAMAAGAIVLKRPEALAGDDVGTMDVLHHDMPKVMDSATVLFNLATAPLLRRIDYHDAVALLGHHPGGIVMSVVRHPESALLALKSAAPETGLLEPAFPEAYDAVQQSALPSTFSDAGCLYAFKADSVAGVSRLVDLRPLMALEFRSDVAIDVNTPEDWARLEQSWKKCHS